MKNQGFLSFSIVLSQDADESIYLALDLKTVLKNFFQKFS